MKNKSISRTPAVHKLHQLASFFFVVIDDEFVKSLSLNSGDSWFEQRPVEGGIFLRVTKLGMENSQG